MKLLFALPGFHRFDRGAEVALLSVAEELALNGENVTVMGAGQARAKKPYKFEHVSARSREKFEDWPNFLPFRSETAWEDAAFALNLLRRYKPSEFDATITCAFPFTHLALRKPTPKKPKHIFVTQNGDWPAYSNKSEYRAFRCDGLICTNPDYFVRNEAKWNCALVPNGIDRARFKPGEPERQRLGLPVDRPIVLMVSAFIETKRVEDGIRAVSQLDDAVLVVAGDGPLRERATRLANELLPDRFIRVSLPANEMPSLYRSSDAFLHMSLLESFGNVFVEAWGCGLPVVGHDTPRLRWIMGENTRYLCNTEDLELVAAALSDAIAHGKRQEVSQSGIERFTWPVIAAQYRDFISGTVRV